MKKVFTKMIGFSMLAGTFLFANSSFAQLEEGDLMLDINYGIPSKGIIFASIDAANSNVYNDVTTSYLGPAGIRFQYMIASNFGIGFEGNYTKRTATWRESESFYNATTGQYEDNFYEASLSQTVIRGMFRTSWEMVNEEKFAVNWANSIGYRKAIWELKPDDYVNSWSFGTWPIAFRTAVGVRYWIAEQVGINAEFGLSGGAYLNVGISAKL